MSGLSFSVDDSQLKLSGQPLNPQSPGEIAHALHFLKESYWKESGAGSALIWLFPTSLVDPLVYQFLIAEGVFITFCPKEDVQWVVVAPFREPAPILLRIIRHLFPDDFLTAEERRELRIQLQTIYEHLESFASEDANFWSRNPTVGMLLNWLRAVVSSKCSEGISRWKAEAAYPLIGAEVILRHGFDTGWSAEALRNLLHEGATEIERINHIEPSLVPIGLTLRSMSCWIDTEIQSHRLEEQRKHP